MFLALYIVVSATAIYTSDTACRRSAHLVLLLLSLVPKNGPIQEKYNRPAARFMKHDERGVSTLKEAEPFG